MKGDEQSGEETQWTGCIDEGLTTCHEVGQSLTVHEPELDDYCILGQAWRSNKRCIEEDEQWGPDRATYLLCDQGPDGRNHGVGWRRHSIPLLIVLSPWLSIRSPSHFSVDSSFCLLPSSQRWGGFHHSFRKWIASIYLFIIASIYILPPFSTLAGYFEHHPTAIYSLTFLSSMLVTSDDYHHLRSCIHLNNFIYLTHRPTIQLTSSVCRGSINHLDPALSSFLHSTSISIVWDTEGVEHYHNPR